MSCQLKATIINIFTLTGIHMILTSCFGFTICNLLHLATEQLKRDIISLEVLETKNIQKEGDS